MARKSIKFVELIDDVNARNCRSSVDPVNRQAWNHFLETILQREGLYAGWTHVRADQLENAALREKCDPGVIFGENGDNPKVMDDSRRIYAKHKNLV